MTALVVAPCDRAAAEYAVTHWHYSGVMATGKMVCLGAWEDGSFIGAVTFSRGASPYLGRALELDHTEICELTRVALTTHKSPVSQIVARALRILAESSPGLRVVVSFADPSEGHHGGIYQAMNWTYTGQSGWVTEYFVRGRWRHKKGVWYELRETGRQGENLPVIEDGLPVAWRRAPGKYRYLYPLDSGMRRRLRKMAKPYPVADADV